MQVDEGTLAPVRHDGEWYVVENDFDQGDGGVVVHRIGSEPYGLHEYKTLAPEEAESAEHATGIASCPDGLAVATNKRVVLFDRTSPARHEARVPSGFNVKNIEWCGGNANVLAVVYGNDAAGDAVAALDFRADRTLVGLLFEQPRTLSPSSPSPFVSSICCSSDTNSLVVGCTDGYVKVCDARFARPGEEVRSFQAPPSFGAVSALASCPARRNWVVAGYAQSPVVKCVNTFSGMSNMPNGELQTGRGMSNGAFDTGRSGTTALAFGGAKGNELYSAHPEPNERAANSVRCWRVSEGIEGPRFEHMQDLAGHRGHVTGLAASDDNSRVFSVGGYVDGDSECTFALSEWRTGAANPCKRKITNACTSVGGSSEGLRSEGSRYEWRSKLAIR